MNPEQSFIIYNHENPKTKQITAPAKITYFAVSKSLKICINSS